MQETGEVGLQEPLKENAQLTNRKMTYAKQSTKEQKSIKCSILS